MPHRDLNPPSSPGLTGSGTRYFDALVGLNDDGKEEAIVYVTGPGWCGSGQPIGNNLALTGVVLVQPEMD
ncbi:MAG: hypothetical protein DMG13_30190 [Acidobacteria bacterium]|nr:MAG: hypothetical protein DMG13_30190 [Acidobacteriota bacterium]